MNEDKLLGPFFIAPEQLDDPETFAKALKDKALLYHCEDAAKMKKPSLFKGCDRKTITYSYACDEFDVRDEEIFGLSPAEEQWPSRESSSSENATLWTLRRSQTKRTSNSMAHAA